MQYYVPLTFSYMLALSPQYSIAGQQAGLGPLYVNLSASPATVYGYDDPACSYYNNSGTYGANYFMQALAPATGCTAQRILVSNSTAYGQTTQVSVFNAAAGPQGSSDPCLGNSGPSPNILTTVAAGSNIPVVSGNTILVLGKGSAYASPPSVIM